MSSIYTHLKSNIPCIVYANGEYLGISKKRESLDLLISNKEVYFNISPVGNFYPYTLHLVNVNQCIETTNNCLLVPYYNNNYDIILKNMKIHENTPTTTLVNTTINSITVTILNGINSSITIYDDGKIVYSDVLKLLDKANATMVQNNLVVKGFTTEKEYFVLILDKEYNLVYSGYFDTLDETNNILTGFTNLYDMAKHGHVCEIDLNNTKELKDYFVVKENQNFTETKELVPQAFLEAIKVKNYNLAKNYLSPSLANASNDHFQSYFGNIQDIYYNIYNNANPINYTIYNGEYRFFNFSVKGNKIVDIEEVSK